MKIRVNPHTVEIVKEQTEPINEKEIKVSKCEFEFDEAITSDFVKEAYFTLNGNTYKQIIQNNECDYPSEVLTEKGTLEIGVVAFKVENGEEIVRYNPSPDYFESWVGSLKSAENSEPITPSEMEQFEQELQEGLNEISDKIDEVDDKITEVNTAITETNNLNLEVSDKVDGDVTVTLTKKDASTKSVVISDGTSLQFMWQGTSLGIKTDDMSEYVFVDLQGVQGVPGPKGDAFQIKKTYPTVEAMNADFNNMELGDYVMIASEVSIEDNAKLYTRGQNAWIFISDFSGAQGIKGETGATPNIQIGTVTSGSTPSVTRTGTNENPVLNFVLQPGPQGDTGPTGPTGNGIDHISLTSQSGATKVYTIYFTDGNTTTFTVEDGEVTQEVFDEEIERTNMIYNAMPKVSGEGTDLTLNNTAECPVYDIELSPSELEQATTTGRNILNPEWWNTPSGTIISVQDGSKFTITTRNGTGRAAALHDLTELFQANAGKTIAWTFKSIDASQYSSVSQTIAQLSYVIGEGSTRYAIPLTTSSSSTVSFLIPDNITSATLYMYGNNNNTALTSDNIVVFDELMLQISDTISTEWEPYTNGASPNPQYPQEIHTVSGENTVVVGNKNLFDEDSVEFVTGILDDNGNPTGSTTSHYTNNYYNVRPNTDYVLSGTLQNTSGDAIRIYFYSKDKNWISRSNIFNTNSVSFTTPSNCYHIRIQIRNIVTLQTHDVMLRVSTTSTDYVEHQEQTYPISLGNLEYCKIGDYEDLFMKSSGKNLFDKDSATTEVAYFKSDGTIASGGSSTITTSYTKIIPNTDMVFSGITPEYICFYDENKNFIERVSGITTFNKNAYYIRFQETTSTLDLNKIQLEVGTTPTSYEPYGVGTWYLKKNTLKYDSLHTRTWNLNNKVFYASVNVRKPDTITTQNIYCPVYKWNGNYSTVSYANGNMNNNEIATNNNGSSTNIFIRDDRFETTDDLKNYLSTNNVFAYIVLATPENILLSDTLQTQLENIHKAISYQDQTNVSQTNNDLPFVIKMSAIRDLSGIFEEI